MSPLPLAITTGDPGGVGPRISVHAARATLPHDRAVLYGDAHVLAHMLRDAGVADECIRTLDRGSEAALAQGCIGVVHVDARWDSEALRHEPTLAGGRAQLEALDAAIDAAYGQRVRAIVTAPMSKSAVTRTGADFMGHTEHLARACGLADDDVTMMFLGPRLRVALVTTHIAIAALPQEITASRVTRTVKHLAEVLLRVPAQAQALSNRQHFRKSPRLVVTGLNPHAGEGGLFGDEEIVTVAPALARLRAESPFSDSRITLLGPSPAETVFRQAANGEIDGVVAMSHDQATIASKLLDWGHAVNVTWGLPFVRTSVDHGVAYDAAESGHIEYEGMLSALHMAQQLTAML